MAGNVKGIIIELGGDTSGLQNALNKVNRETYDLQKELKGVETLLKFNPKNTELLAQKQKLLTEQITKTDEKLKTLKEAQQQYIKSGGDLNTPQYRNLQREIISTEGKLKNLKKEALDSNVALNKMKDVLKTVGEVGKVAGTIAVASIVAIGTSAVATGKKLFNLTKATSDYGDEIDKESQKLGVSAENYQKLDYALQMNGASINDVSKGVKTITTELGKAENGVADAGKQFKELGVSLVDTDGKIKSNEQVLLESIDALSKMENENQRNAIAQEIFGKSSAELKPLLNSGAEGIQQLMEEAENYGMVMNNDAVLASATFNDSLTRLTKTVGGLKNKLGASLMPAITDIMDGLSMAFSGKGGEDKIQSGINSLADSLNKGLPVFINFVNNIAKLILDNAPMIIQTLVEGILNALPTILPSLVNIITGIATTLISSLPQLLTTGIQLVLALAKGIGEAVPQLLATLPDLITDMVEVIMDWLPDIINAGVDLLLALVNGLLQAIPQLIDMLPTIIDTIVTTLIDNLDLIIDAGMRLLIGVIDGLIQALPQLVGMIPTIIFKIVDTLINNLPKIIETGAKILVTLAEAIIKTIPKLIEMLPQIFTKMKDALLGYDWLGLGKDVIRGICEGLSSAGNIIWDAIKKVGNSMLDGIKNFFGIESPSKLMRDEVGTYLAKGIGVGFVDGMKNVNKLINTSIPKDYTFDTSVTDDRKGIARGNTLNIYTQELDSEKLEEILKYVDMKFGIAY